MTKTYVPKPPPRIVPIIEPEPEDYSLDYLPVSRGTNAATAVAVAAVAACNVVANNVVSNVAANNVAAVPPLQQRSAEPQQLQLQLQQPNRYFEEKIQEAVQKTRNEVMSKVTADTIRTRREIDELKKNRDADRTTFTEMNTNLSAEIQLIRQSFLDTDTVGDILKLKDKLDQLSRDVNQLKLKVEGLSNIPRGKKDVTFK